MLIGPHSFFPLAAISKKQTATSHSSPEAELVALTMALKDEGIPALDLWEIILGRLPKLTLHEDNQAAAQIVRTGKSQKLRHVRRTHGIAISALHDWYKRKVFTLADCHTQAQAADVFTKAFTDPEAWERAVALIGMIDGPTSRRLLKQGGAGTSRAAPAQQGSSGASSEAPLASCDPSKGGASPRIQNSSAERRPGALHNKVHQCLKQGLKS